MLCGHRKGCKSFVAWIGRNRGAWLPPRHQSSAILVAMNQQNQSTPLEKNDEFN